MSENQLKHVPTSAETDRGPNHVSTRQEQRHRCVTDNEELKKKQKDSLKDANCERKSFIPHPDRGQCEYVTDGQTTQMWDLSLCALMEVLLLQYGRFLL